MGIGVSLSGLASAVANQGGIGVISATGIGLLRQAEPGSSFKEHNLEALRAEIRKAKSLTHGILGINILVALTDYPELAKAALEEGIDLIFLGAGLPLHKPDSLDSETWLAILDKVVPIVSSGRAAGLICRHWQKHFQKVPDAFVVEGPLAGGHLGFSKANLESPAHQLESILPEVIEAIKPYEESCNKPISVIVGGGVFTGTDIFKFLQLGAQGVQMASRFVGTFECDASEEFKQSYIQSKKEDLVIIDSPVGLPGRAIRNQFLNNVAEGLRHPVKCPWKCLITCDFKKSPYCIAQALKNAQMGELAAGFAFAGANAYRIQAITSVKELIDSLVSEFNREAAYFCKKKAMFHFPPVLLPCPQTT